MELIFLPGSTGNITWKFDDDLSKILFRYWSFTSSEGSTRRTFFVLMLAGNRSQQKICKGVLPKFDIIKPATLVLYNLNQSYDGTYRFRLSLYDPVRDFTSEVRVFIARKMTSKYFANDFHRPFLAFINLYKNVKRKINVFIYSLWKFSSHCGRTHG